MREVDTEFGDLLSEARLTTWLRVPTVTLLLFLTFYAGERLLGWVQLSLPQRGIFLLMAVVFPIYAVEALARRFRFYEHGIIYRKWAGKCRRLAYDQVRAVYGQHTSTLTIYWNEHREIEILKSEGDLVRIAELIRERPPNSPPRTSKAISESGRGVGHGPSGPEVPAVISPKRVGITAKIPTSEVTAGCFLYYRDGCKFVLFRSIGGHQAKRPDLVPQPPAERRRP